MNSSLNDAARNLTEHGFAVVTVGRNDGRALVGARVWPHYWDRVAILSDTEATAERALIDARPGPDAIVWCWRGDPLTAVAELLRLPKPHEPTAPRLARPVLADLWQLNDPATAP